MPAPSAICRRCHYDTMPVAACFTSRALCAIKMRYAGAALSCCRYAAVTRYFRVIYVFRYYAEICHDITIPFDIIIYADARRYSRCRRCASGGYAKRADDGVAFHSSHASSSPLRYYDDTLPPAPYYYAAMRCAVAYALLTPRYLRYATFSIFTPRYIRRAVAALLFIADFRRYYDSAMALPPP